MVLMPLTPLPANNTDRAWLKYTSKTVEHELCFRLPSTATQAQFITTATAIANGLKAWMNTSDSFTGLRHQDSGSTVSFPLAWTSIAGTNAEAIEADEGADFLALSGRSLAGYRCRVTFFTGIINPANGYREPPSTAGSTKALYDTITGLSPALVAIDGALVVWNAYINIGRNAYWTRQLR